MALHSVFKFTFYILATFGEKKLHNLHLPFHTLVLICILKTL